MAKYINNEFSSSDWLRYFSNKSNHWILKYWRNNKDIFFNRFMIIGDKRLLDRKSTRLNSSHLKLSRMPSSA